MSSCHRPRSWFLCLVVLLLGSSAATPAFAALDPVRAARAMAEQGTKAYESADFARAAQLYHEAFRTDPSQTVYLYSAARAEHVGGQLDRALQHYQQFAQTAGANAGLATKANAYIDEVHRAQVDAQVQEAEGAARARHHSAAAQFFLAAYAAASDRPELLFKAAVAEELAGETQGARQHYREYLEKAPADASDRGLAKVKLAGLDHGAEPEPARAPTPTAPVAAPAAHQAASSHMPVTVAQTPPSASRWQAWTVLGGGVALLAGGVGIFASTLADSSALQSQLAQKDGGKISGTTYAAATSQASSINQTRAISGVMAGVGLAATGVGTWMLLRAPEKVALVPGPALAGVGLAMRF